MVGPWPLAPHHDYLQYIHHIHLMQQGQNHGVTHIHARRAQHLYPAMWGTHPTSMLEGLNTYI